MSPPTNLAILIGAGPNTGTGITRILTSPSHGNLAIALLARSKENLTSVKNTVLQSNPSAIIETFPTDTQPNNLTTAFTAIKSHPSFAGLKLTVAIFSVKHASKKDFLAETWEEYTSSLSDYAGGAMVFAQLAIKRLFDDHGDTPLSESGGAKKGTLIFTGTLAALRTTTAGYAAYSGGRAAVRMLAMGLAKDFSARGVHVVHSIANGGIEDADGEEQRAGRKMSADAVGREYWRYCEQGPELWTFEADLRPAGEKF